MVYHESRLKCTPNWVSPEWHEKVAMEQRRRWRVRQEVLRKQLVLLQAEHQVVQRHLNETSHLRCLGVAWEPFDRGCGSRLVHLKDNRHLSATLRKASSVATQSPHP